MHTHLQTAAPTPVAYGPDGTPYYAAPPAPAPLALYQPVTGLPAPAAQHRPATLTAYLPEPMDVPGRDPWPARLLAGGVALGAGGIGLSFLLQALAAATTGLGLLAAVLALVWLLKNGSGSGGGRGGAVNVHVNVTNRNR
ncbi:hypothetical protein ACIHEI_07010 [Kitasatospora sp. NPDC051984]|uniref:hypothetical protein n=1 Tax=Kitasatospora sp. NPDC051984 TaxID=3364059 RepID=UPI0037C82863